MYNKKFVIFFIALIFSIVFLSIYFKFFENNKTKVIQSNSDEKIYNSNIIKDVEYTTKDKDGNEYLIKAKEGEIDFSNSNIIYHTWYFCITEWSGWFYY